jgi:transcription elongation factor Elf1
LPRNNTRRTGSTPKKETQEVTPAPPTSVLDFVNPTEHVALPSGGRFYDEDHPLHGQDTVEIRFMTAKDEDILTSQSLLKNGTALEKLMQNILVDKRVNPSSMLIGDRSAILIAARATGYGKNYETNVTCPSCGEMSKTSFDITNFESFDGDVEKQEELGVSVTPDNTYKVKLPLTTVTAEFRLLTGADEAAMTRTLQKRRNKSSIDGSLSTQFVRAVVSLSGETDRDIIKKFSLLMPASDARHLRSAIRSVTPSVDLTQHFECPECGHEQDMEVPLTADFFWPNS